VIGKITCALTGHIWLDWEREQKQTEIEGPDGVTIIRHPAEEVRRCWDCGKEERRIAR
jgi:hypothetical protein